MSEHAGDPLKLKTGTVMVASVPAKTVCVKAVFFEVKVFGWHKMLRMNELDICESVTS